jgi:hypothetical protein
MESGSPLTPLGAALAALATILIVLLPRRHAIMPIFAGVVFLPIGQSLNVAGLHFYLFRLVLLAALVRMLIRGEARSVRWCRLDTLVLSWSIAVVVFGSLSHPGFAAMTTLLGGLYNGLASYIVARALVRDRGDFLLQLRFLAIMIVPLVVAMAVEKATGKNLFAVLGGVSATTLIREGKVRAQGAFQHPILAGTFGATLVPLMLGLARMRDRRLKWSGVLGSVGSVAITLAAASSGALLAAETSAVALCLWPLRHSMRLLRIGLVLLVLVLQAGMNRPVWWIFDTVGAITGGTGWHRSYIIDAAIQHWREWFLVGTPVTAHWGGYPPPPNDPLNIDITNQFIAEAVGGGALRLILFVTIIATCFKHLGVAFRGKRRFIHPETEWLAWSTGVALVAHCIGFFSVAYFDQLIFFWFWLLAVFAAGTMERKWLVRDRPPGPARRDKPPRSLPPPAEPPRKEPSLSRLRRTAPGTAG